MKKYAYARWALAAGRRESFQGLAVLLRADFGVSRLVVLAVTSFFGAACGRAMATTSAQPATTGYTQTASPRIARPAARPAAIPRSEEPEREALAGPSVSSISAGAHAAPGRWRNITPRTVDLSRHSCTDLQFDPSNPRTLYAFYGTGGGIWRSRDAGETWLQIGDMPQPNSLGRILVNPRDPRHLYATGSVDLGSWGFWVSRDGGATWRIPAAFQAGAATIWNLDVYNLAADPSDFNHVLLTFHRGWPGWGDQAGVLETKDGGASFIVHDPAPGMDHGQGIAFLFDPANQQGNSDTWLVGAGYGAGLFRTTNAGKSWRLVAPLQQNHGGFDAHYSAQGFLYIGARDGVYRSTDNGASWRATGVTGNWYYGVIGDGKRLYTSPAYVGQVYDMPFLVTPEGGPNEALGAWVPHNEQTFGEGPWRMVFEPTRRVIYAAAWSSGAWAMDVKP